MPLDFSANSAPALDFSSQSDPAPDFSSQSESATFESDAPFSPPRYDRLAFDPSSIAPRYNIEMPEPLTGAGLMRQMSESPIRSLTPQEQAAQDSTAQRQFMAESEMQGFQMVPVAGPGFALAAQREKAEREGSTVVELGTVSPMIKHHATAEEFEAAGFGHNTSEWMAAAHNVAANIANGLGTPEGVAMLGGGGLAKGAARGAVEVAAKAYATQIALSAPVHAAEAAEAYKAGDFAKFKEKLLQATADAGMAAGAVRSKGPTGEPSPLAELSREPRLTPPEIARAQRAATNLAAPGTRPRSTEIEGVAPQIEEPPGGIVRYDLSEADFRPPAPKPPRPVFFEEPEGPAGKRVEPAGGKLGFQRTAEDIGAPAPERTQAAIAAERDAESRIRDEIDAAQEDPMRRQQAMVRLEDLGERWLAAARRRWAQSGLSDAVPPEGYTAIDELILRAKFTGDGLELPLVRLRRALEGPRQEQAGGKVSFAAEAPTLLRTAQEPAQPPNPQAEAAARAAQAADLSAKALKDLEAALRGNQVKPVETKPKGKPTPEEWERLLNRDDPALELRDEGVRPENVKALLDGTKTAERVVDEQLGVRKRAGGLDADTIIVEENSDGSRSIGFSPEAGPASTTPVNVGQMSHVDAIMMAREQGIERIQSILRRRKPNALDTPKPAGPPVEPKPAPVEAPRAEPRVEPEAPRSVPPEPAPRSPVQEEASPATRPELEAAKGRPVTPVRVTDVESGETIQIKQFPTYDVAEKHFRDETSKAEAMERPKPIVAPAIEKIKNEIESVAATEGQRPAREVKSELVRRLEEAHEAAPSAEDVRVGLRERTQLTIHIPGDGTFKMWNVKENIAGVLKSAKAIDARRGGAATKIPRARKAPYSKEARAAEDALKVYGSPERARRFLSQQLEQSEALELSADQTQLIRGALARLPSPKPSAPSPNAPGIVPRGTPELMHMVDSAQRFFQRKAREARSSFLARHTRDFVVATRDAVDNAAGRFARNVTTALRGQIRRDLGNEHGVRGALRSAGARIQRRQPGKIVEEALTFVVEAESDPARLAQFRQQVATATHVSSEARRRALAAISYAEANLPALRPIADNFNAITDRQVAAENAAGVDTLRHPNYVPHAQDIDTSMGFPNARSGGAGGSATPFRKIREHATYADSMAAGVEPHTLNSVDLLQSRLTRGQKLIGQRNWIEGLRQTIDPASNAPLVENVTMRTRADGSTYAEPPRGYHIETLGSQHVAVHNGYEGLFRAINDPSAFRNSAAGRFLTDVNGLGKAVTLAIDTFHLGRLAFWNSVIKSAGITTFRAPFPTYRRGLTLLDYSIPEIRQMIASGDIPQRWGQNLIQDKTRLNLAVRTGFNVGRIQDAMHTDLIKMVPGLGAFNTWLFDQYQRGAMAESWLLEFERMTRQLPNLPPEQVARRVSKDLNARFGNLSRQGILKSQTMKDLARLVMLAPEWNEGLIRSELGAVRQAGETAYELVRNRRLVTGTLLRSVGVMLVGQFAANQLINYITRGKPTWENDEEGIGAKLSAWIPDHVGGGPGFFLHPAGLAAEITHLVEQGYEKTDDWQQTVNQLLRSRVSYAMRPLLQFITNKDVLGRTMKPGAVWGEMAKSAVPAPISAGAAYLAGKSAVTGQREEQFPGQFQKQLAGSVGIKMQGAPDLGQRISALAREFNEKKGIEPQAEFYAGDFVPLVQAIRVGNAPNATEALAELLKKKTRKQVFEHFKYWQAAPFTHSKPRESEFWRSLEPQQREAYHRARADRERIAKAVLKLLKESPTVVHP